jgi:hypothetical protein
MDVLASFYTISQGSTSFTDFATQLQETHNALSTGSTGFTINESVLKNHLFFFCHPILSLCICSIPTFDYPKTRVDALITIMSATWDSMIAEHVIRPPNLPSSSNVPTIPSSMKPTKGFVALTKHERESLKQAGGCYHCHHTPSSLGWTKHNACYCPGDEANGITLAPIHTVTAVLEEDEDESGDDFMAAVFPTCVLGISSF